MIFIGMNHPKHFWMFNEIIAIFDQKEVNYKIFVSEKDVLPELLNSAFIPHIKLGRNKKGIWNKILQSFIYFIKMLSYSIKYKPTIFIGQALPHFAFSSFLFPKSKFYILEDTEHVSFLHKLTVPFCSKIVTPIGFPKKFGEKQVFISSYYELLYLHPNYFKVEPKALKSIGLTTHDNFAIIRLVSWDAHHDKNENGMDTEFILQIIRILESKGIEVLISSEQPLAEELESYSLKINAKSIHSLLFYANCYIGEGATMAAEAAILGTPAIYVNSLDTSYCNELANRYQLMYSFRSTSGVIQQLYSILNSKATPQNHKRKKDVMLNDKIDPVCFILSLMDL